MGLLRSPPTRIPQPLPSASPVAENIPASPLTQPPSPQTQPSQVIQTQPFQSQSQIARSPPQTQIPQPAQKPVQSQSQIQRSPPQSIQSSDVLQLQNTNANLSTLLQQMQNKNVNLEAQLEQLKQSNDEATQEHERQLDELQKERQAELQQRDDQIDELLQAVKEEKEDLMREVEAEKVSMRHEIEEEREKMRAERLAEKERLGQEAQSGSKEAEEKLEYALDMVAMLESDLRLAKYDAEVRVADEVLDVIREGEKERKAKLALVDAQTELHQVKTQLSTAEDKLSTRTSQGNYSLQTRYDTLAESYRVCALSLTKTDAAKRKAEQTVRTLETELAAAKRSGGGGANYEELVTELKCTKKELKVAEKRLKEAGETIAQVSRDRHLLSLAHTMMEDDRRKTREDYDNGIRDPKKRVMKHTGPAPLEVVAAFNAADEAVRKRKRAADAEAEKEEEEDLAVVLLPSPAKKPRAEQSARFQIELSDSEDEEEAQPQPKQKGRPPKTSAGSTQDAEVKRPIGRPRKHPLPDPDASPEETSPPKKRGRPKKTEEEKAKAELAKAMSPKRPIGRPRKSPDSPAKSAVANEAIQSAPTAEAPLKKLGRSKKVVAEAEEQEVEPEDETEVEAPPPKKRGRPPKKAHPSPVVAAEEQEADEAIASASEIEEAIEEPPAKKPRGRPKKPQPEVDEPDPSPPKKRGRPKKVVAEAPEEPEPESDVVSKQLLAGKEKAKKPSAKSKKAAAGSALSLAGPSATGHKRTTSAAALLAEGSRSPEPDLLKTKKKKIKLAPAPSVEKWAQDWEMQETNAFDLPTHLSPVKGGSKSRK